MYQKVNKELEILDLYLGGYRDRFYLREIKKLSDLSLGTTQNVLSRLEDEDILRSEKEGKNKYYRLNFENIQTKFSLLRAEVYRTQKFLENYPRLKIFVSSLKSNAPVVVFGSFAKMSADEGSDLDLLVVSEEEMPFHLVPQEVHEVRLSEDSFIEGLEKDEDLLKETEENHVLLNNHSFYVNTMWRYYV